MDVLAAGKAVGKQRVGARLPVGAIEQRGKFLALGVGKIEALSRHALLPWTDCLRQSTAGFALAGQRPLARAKAHYAI
jgi:hypothetical protein